MKFDRLDMYYDTRNVENTEFHAFNPIFTLVGRRPTGSRTNENIRKSVANKMAQDPSAHFCPFSNYRPVTHEKRWKCFKIHVTKWISVIYWGLLFWNKLHVQKVYVYERYCNGKYIANVYDNLYK